MVGLSLLDSPDPQDPQDSPDPQDPQDPQDTPDQQDPQDTPDPPELMNDIPEWMWDMWWNVLKKMPCTMCAREIRKMIWTYFDTLRWGEWIECPKCQLLLVKCEKCPLEHNQCTDCAFMFNYYLTCHKKWCDEMTQNCQYCQYCQAFPALSAVKPKYIDRFDEE